MWRRSFVRIGRLHQPRPAVPQRRSVDGSHEGVPDFCGAFTRSLPRSSPLTSPHLAVLILQHHLPRPIVILKLHHPRPKLPRWYRLPERWTLQERVVQQRLGARHGERLVSRPPPDRDSRHHRRRLDRSCHLVGDSSLPVLPRRSRQTRQGAVVLVGVRDRSAANGAERPVWLLPFECAAAARRILRSSARSPSSSPTSIDRQA